MAASEIKKLGRRYILHLAKVSGKSEKEVRQVIQDSIDESWAVGNAVSLQYQLQFYPKGKPTPEEFIVKSMEEWVE